MDFLPLATESRVALMTPDHPLAAKEKLSMSDLNACRTYVNRLSSLSSLKKTIKEEEGEAHLIELPCDMQTVFQVCLNGSLYLVAESYARKFRPLIARPLEFSQKWNFGLAYRVKHSAVVDDFLTIATNRYRVPLRNKRKEIVDKNG